MDVFRITFNFLKYLIKFPQNQSAEYHINYLRHTFFDSISCPLFYQKFFFNSPSFFSIFFQITAKFFDSTVNFNIFVLLQIVKRTKNGRRKQIGRLSEKKNPEPEDTRNCSFKLVLRTYVRRIIEKVFFGCEAVRNNFYFSRLKNREAYFRIFFGPSV